MMGVQKRRRRRWLAILAGSLALYMLSIGPAGVVVNLIDRSPDSPIRSAAIAFYQPVIATCKAIGAEQELVEYEMLWIDPVGYNPLRSLFNR